MSRRVSFLVTGAAVTLGFALLAWVSSAGSVLMFQTPAPAAARRQEPQPTPSLEEQPAGRAGDPTPPSGSQGPDLAWLESLLTALLLLAALVVVLLLARSATMRRWRRLSQPAEAPFEVLPEVSVALANDAPAQFAALEEGSPRNAIVACWLRLEEVAAEAGVPPHPAETSTEFTTRVLGALAFDPAMINGFAGLYREARFSRHELGEPARQAAVAALRSLYDDIGAPYAVASDLGDQGAR